MDDIQVFGLFPGECVLLNQFKITENAGQRRAQVVGDVGNLPTDILFTLCLFIASGKGLGEVAVDFLRQQLQMAVGDRHLQMTVGRLFLIHVFQFQCKLIQRLVERVEAH